MDFGVQIETERKFMEEERRKGAKSKTRALG
jgi:hypothetical protein